MNEQLLEILEPATELIAGASFEAGLRIIDGVAKALTKARPAMSPAALATEAMIYLAAGRLFLAEVQGPATAAALAEVAKLRALLDGCRAVIAEAKQCRA